jgi:flagellin-like hook-associated protein FlgL
MLSGIPNLSSTLLMQRSSRLNAQMLAQTMNRLSTGRRINRAADDPAGLIASEQLRATLATLEAESQSLQRTDHIGSTADGALGEVSVLLSEANSLAVANANDAGLSDAEKQANQLQIDSISSSIDRISRTTTFNGTRLLDGTAALSATNKSLPISSVAPGSVGKVKIDGEDRTLADVRSGGAINAIDDPESAQRAIGAAISQVSTLRGKIGAFQKNTIRTRLNSIDVAYVNIASAESQIRDLDYALEASRMARFELLRATSMILSRAPRSARGIRLDILG